MSDIHRTVNSAFKQDPLIEDAAELVALLQDQENRDKLEGPLQTLAGSLINRRAWSANKLKDDELKKFIKQAKNLVDSIEDKSNRTDARRSE